MKRKNFLISYDDKKVIKHAWNSSIRAIEAIVRKTANEEKTTYDLINQDSIRNEYKEHVKGFREWKGENGRIIRFNIEKQ